MFSRQEKFLLSILACIQFSHIVDFMIMMPLGPALMRTFHINPQEFGLLVSAYTFSAGLSGILASLFIDKFDRKSCLLFFYVGFGIGTVACGLADDYPTLLITRALTGAFGGVLGSLVMAIVGDAISLEKRATAIGITSASFSVASVLGVPFSLYLANHFDWHAPFLFLGLVSIVFCFMAYSFVPRMTNHLKGPHKETNIFYALIHIGQTPNLIFALLFMFFLIFGQFCLIPFLSPSLVANAGLAEDQLPFVYLVGGLVSIVSSPLSGRLSDRYGKKNVFMIAALISALPIYFITHLGVNPVPVTLTVVAFFFMSISGRMVPAMATISAAATPKYRGSFMSVATSVQQLSAAAASYVAGVIVIKDSQGHLLHYSHMGYLAICFIFVAIYFSRKIKELA